jgi:hypothetical protein
VYLEYFDSLLIKADSLRLYICLLPFWAQALNKYSSDEPFAFGEKSGVYFRKYPNLIWCVGGEAAGESFPEDAESLAAGFEKGSQGSQLFTVHPSGFRLSLSGEYWISETNKGLYNFQRSAWLDFNMLQSGYMFNYPNYKLIDNDYTLTPAKSAFEPECFYEDHADWEHLNDSAPPRAGELEARKGAARFIQLSCMFISTIFQQQEASMESGSMAGSMPPSKIYIFLI